MSRFFVLFLIYFDILFIPGWREAEFRTICGWSRGANSLRAETSSFKQSQGWCHPIDGPLADFQGFESSLQREERRRSSRHRIGRIKTAAVQGSGSSLFDFQTLFLQLFILRIRLRTQIVRYLKLFQEPIGRPVFGLKYFE